MSTFNAIALGVTIAVMLLCVAVTFKTARRTPRLDLACSIVFYLAIYPWIIASWFYDPPTWWLTGGISIGLTSMVISLWRNERRYRKMMAEAERHRAQLLAGLSPEARALWEQDMGRHGR
jgi:O-antigen ligase